MNKPNFFILGAPKCGTTSLAFWLGEHPLIYLPPVKEPNTFSSDVPAIVRYTEREYRTLYSNLPLNKVWVCDASTTYLRSRVAVKEIINFSDDPLGNRYLVAVRNPIEMVLSLHAHRVRGGREDQISFEDAWRNDLTPVEAKAGYTSPRNDLSTYGAVCKLGEQLDRLFKAVDRDQVHVVFLEDVVENSKREYLKILDFLGLPDDNRTDFPVLNPASSIPSWLAQSGRWMMEVKNFFALKKSFGIGKKLIRSFGRSVQKSSLSNDLRAELKAYFAEDVQLLGELLERDLSGWM